MARRDETPRDLLFGLLALHTGLIDQDQLLAAFGAWARAKGRTLAEILVERGSIDEEERSLLAGMAEKQLKKHGGDAEKSLASIAVGTPTREKLAALGDTDLTASVAQIRAQAPSRDASATMTLGTSTSDGQRFRVLRPHAQGGLGAVFVALDGELNREVALKQILDHHADDPLSRTRFLIEAEITGGLEHPGIVPVYGLGRNSDGRPYYAMRFIRGDSLKDAIASFHSDESLGRDPGKKSLALRKLLRRFVDVCNAIDYAHGRGVLHRDLKPGNVIVGKHGETLVVDWGLAKPMGHAELASATDERTLMPSSASGSAETLPGSALGTPAYMSPEQAMGDLEHLGPRSDVYSLGATLYCLLTGKSPFEGKDLGTVLRDVQKGAFPPPRQVDPSVDRALEAVCLKAMAMRPEGRYPTARALADDVERWTADEPVSAYRDPAPVRLARWARKHRTGVAVGAGVLQTAVVVLAVSTVLLGQSRARLDRERRAAEAAKSRAQAVNSFLVDDLLGQADPERNPAGEDLTVRQLLDRAAKSMGRSQAVAREPGVEGAVRSTVGDAYLGLGLYEEAAEQLSVAERLLELASAPWEDRIFTRNRAIWAKAMKGGSSDATEAARSTFAESEERLGRDHPETVYAADTWAQLGRNRPNVDAMKILRENLEIQRRRFGRDHQLSLRAVGQLVIGLAYKKTDADLAEAESLSRESCDLWVKRYGAEFPEALYALSERGLILALLGRLQEARSVLAPLPDAYTRALGPEHFQRASTLRTYGSVLEALGDLDGAEAQYRAAIPIHSKGLTGRSDVNVQVSMLRACLARVELTRGHDGAAAESLLSILEVHSKTKPLAVPADRLSAALADALAERGDPTEASEILRAIYGDSGRMEPRLDWLLPHFRSLIGGYQILLGKTEAAAKNMQGAIELMEKSHLKPPAPILAAARARLAEFEASHPVATKKAVSSGR